jgi:addiction module RelE/StbE family toxin
MRRVVWSDDALDDLDDAMSYIGADSPVAAHLVVDRIEAAINLLAEMPVGRFGRVKGTYEWHVRRTPYVASYSLTDETLHLLHVLHGSRDWPPGEWPAE